MINSLKRTPLFGAHQRLGARLEPFHGWAVPARFRSPEEEARTARESVAVGDWSWAPKFDLKGPGLKTPPQFEEQAICWPLGVRHYLVTCEPAAQEPLLERIREMEGADSPSPIYCTVVTSVYADLRLVGPRSRDVLSKLSSLEVSEGGLPNYRCGQAAVAEVQAIILRQDLGRQELGRQDLGVMPAFHVLVSRDYAESVWRAVLEAGEEFGIGLFGFEACSLLEV